MRDEAAVQCQTKIIDIINDSIMKQHIETYYFELIVLGFTLHAIGRIGRSIFTNDLLMVLFGTIGWYYIIKGYLHVRGRLSQNGMGGMYNTLLAFYLFQCVVMIVRGYMIDYPYQWISVNGMFNFHLFQKYYILPYLMPLVCFIPWQYYHLEKFTKYGSWIGVVAAITFFVFLPDIIQASRIAMAGLELEKGDSGVQYGFYANFSYATFLVAYTTKKIWLKNMIGLASLVLISMIAARRGGSLINAIVFVAALYMWSKYSGQRIGIIAKFLFIILIGIGVYFVLNSSLFDFLFQRGLEDSRSGVDKALLSQMNDVQQIFGKGLNGRYYYPLLTDDYLDGWRYISETGFYTIVLRGGYLMAFTYILLLAIPAIKGMFQSRNYLCKAGGFYIFVSLIELYPFGLLEFSIKFLIIWMMVVLCMNREVRAMDDEEIQQQFF